MRRKPRRRREGDEGDEGSRVQEGRERRSQSEGPPDTSEQVGQPKVEDLNLGFDFVNVLGEHVRWLSPGWFQ